MDAHVREDLQLMRRTIGKAIGRVERETLDPPPKYEPPFFSSTEAAKFLEITTAELRGLANRNRIGYVRDDAVAHRRYPLSELVRVRLAREEVRGTRAVRKSVMTRERLEELLAMLRPEAP